MIVAAPFSRRPRRLPSLCLAALAGLALTFAGGRAADATPVAQLGEISVSHDELCGNIAALDADQHAAVARDPAALNQLVRTLLVRRALVKEALAKKWEQQPEVAARLERAREDALFESYLQAVSTPPENYPSEAELRTAYEAGKAALLVPRQLRLAQIFINAPAVGDRHAVRRAEEKVAEVTRRLRERDAHFSAIATAWSEEPETSARGGEIGWLPAARIQPAIAEKIAGLATGSVTQGVRLADGWHFIKILEVREARTASFDESRAGLVRQLRAARTQEKGAAHLAKLLRDSPVTVNEFALARVSQAQGR